MPICIENISLSVDKALAVFGHVSVEGGLATLLSVGLEYKCCSVFHLDCASPRGGLANFKISSQAKGLKGWGNCVKLDALTCFLQCRGIGIWKDEGDCLIPFDADVLGCFLGEARLLRRDVTPLLDNGLLHLAGVLPGAGADLLGDVHALLLGLQKGNKLGHVLASTLGLEVASLLGNLIWRSRLLNTVHLKFYIK